MNTESRLNQKNSETHEFRVNLESDRNLRNLIKDRSVVSWAVFDWANSAFATTVIAGFFPVFFKQYWSAGIDPSVSTYQLGNANAFSSGLLAFLSPILGSIADRAKGRKALLLLFTFLGCATTAALFLVAKGHWQLAVFFYVLASIGFAGANTFYDSLLVFVAHPKELDRVSALGFSVGYLGGGLLFALNVFMTIKPHLFGLRDAAQAVQISFLMVAAWWFIFTIPLILFVRESADTRNTPPLRTIVRESFTEIITTSREILKLRDLFFFLLAYFFYIDGVNTIIRMAVDYGLALGFSSTDLITALLLTQFVAFPAAIIYGQLAHRLGAKISLYVSILVYIGVTVFAYFLKTPTDFYFLAVIIGLFQGGIQALSRSVFAKMIPQNKSGEFFGFYNMLGKFSSTMGPILIGWAAYLSGNSRLSILSLIPLFLIGAGFLAFVQMPDFKSR